LARVSDSSWIDAISPHDLLLQQIRSIVIRYTRFRDFRARAANRTLILLSPKLGRQACAGDLRIPRSDGTRRMSLLQARIVERGDGVRCRDRNRAAAALRDRRQGERVRRCSDGAPVSVLLRPERIGWPRLAAAMARRRCELLRPDREVTYLGEISIGARTGRRRARAGGLKNSGVMPGAGAAGRDRVAAATAPSAAVSD